MIIQEMTQTDCRRALAGARVGRLACAHENQPYVVPISFVYQGDCVYGFTTLGQKVEWMRSNPRVCVEVDEVNGNEEWMSLVILGRYEELQDSSDGKPTRLHAHALLQQHEEWWEPGCASRRHHSPEEPLAPVFYRIRIDRVTGRRATRPARERQGWLRRVLLAVSKPFAGRRE